MARPISPPLAASSSATAEGGSPSNQGTTRKSASTVLNGAPEQAITDEVAADGIQILSLMLLARPNARRYNQCSQPPNSRIRIMNGLRRFAASVATSVALATAVTGAQKNDKNAKDQDPRPKVSLTAQPGIAMSPDQAVLT